MSSDPGADPSNLCGNARGGSTLTTSTTSQDATAATGAAVRASGICHSYGELVALRDIDLVLEASGVLALVGPSGCGKSTLLEILAGLREQTEGTAAVGVARSSADRLEHCALMAQRDLLLPWLSAIDNASMAPRLAGLPRAAARDLARPHFERFGLAGFEDTRPAGLSGGMRQRVAFVRTLMAGKPVLLLDEPFAGLDAITRAEMQSWLAGVLNEDAHTVVLVTHDVEEALYLADRVAVMTARPGTISTQIEVPDPRAADRAGAVTAPRFAVLKEQALRALAAGSKRA